MAISADSAYRRRLVLFLKLPRPGSAKSRLARDIGTVAAANWYRIQCQSIIRRVCFDSRWDSYLAISPDLSEPGSRVWLPGIPRIPQGNGDLGVRMSRIFRSLPPGPVIIIGSDVPETSASRIFSAFRLLGQRDAVFGPAIDGGYWLVGLKRLQAPSPNLFNNVRWSSPDTLQDSLASIGTGNVGFVETLRDVDTGNDLRLCNGVTAKMPFTGSIPAILPSASSPRYRFPGVCG